jgi:hypothetical protein
VQGDPYPVSKSDRAALSLWLAALSVRGPARAATTGGPALDGVTDRASARAALIDLGRQPSDSDAEDFFHLTQSVEDQTAESLHRALHLEVMFSKRFWTLLRFATPGLVTCDRPLRVFKGGDPWPDTGPALAAADEIWLPLDRSTAVILHSNSLVGEKVTDAPANFPVDNFNQEVIANAVQEIYCHPADYERVAQLQLARRS